MSCCRVYTAQLLALVCSFIDIVLIIICLYSNEWLVTTGWRQGLFYHCIEQNAPTPLPFNEQEHKPGCYSIRDEGYIRLSAALFITVLVLDFLAGMMIALGICNDSRAKFKYYKCATAFTVGGLISLIASLTVYPVMFKSELHLGNREVWEFGWAYGAACGVGIFLSGMIVLLQCDKDSEQIYYKERKVLSA